MTKVFFTSIFFLCILYPVSSQSSPPIQTYKMYKKFNFPGFFQLSLEEIYHYDEIFHHLNFKESKTYFSNGSLWKCEGEFFEYYPNQQLKKITYKKYDRDQELWKEMSSIEYKYNVYNCLIEELHLGFNGEITQKVRYESNENCRLIRKYTEKLSWVNFGLLYDFREREYFPDSVSYKEYIYLQYTDTLEYGGYEIKKFNSAGNLYLYIKDKQYGSDIMDEYEYDYANNLIRYQNYIKGQLTNEWKKTHVRYEYNEYDEEDNLISKTLETLRLDVAQPGFSENLNKQIFYHGYCHGVPDSIISEKEVIDTYVKEEFTYYRKNDCADFSVASLDIDVFPNPADRFININSSILESDDTYLSVFSTDGKLLLQKHILRTFTGYQLDLSNLDNGVYILNLHNKNYAVQEKIVIAK